MTKSDIAKLRSIQQSHHDHQVTQAAYALGRKQGRQCMLRDVIEWLEDCSIYDTIIHRGESVLVEELRKAMRPEEEQS